MDFSPNSSNSKKCRCSYNCNTCMELIGLWKCVVLWLMLWCLLRVVGETSQSQLRGRWRGFGFGQSAPPPGLDSSLAFPGGRPPPERPREGISPVHPQWTFWEKNTILYKKIMTKISEAIRDENIWEQILPKNQAISLKNIVLLPTKSKKF